MVLRATDSDAVHDVEDVFMLGLDLNIDFLALLLERFLEFGQLDLALADLGDHDHVEEPIHDVLVDVQDVDVVLGQDLADHGDDAHAIFADDGYYEFHLQIPLFSWLHACCLVKIMHCISAQ